jgi:hypothetical protein
MSGRVKNQIAMIKRTLADAEDQAHRFTLVVDMLRQQVAALENPANPSPRHHRRDRNEWRNIVSEW